MKYDVIIIGAGAAGLMCAYSAGSRGKSVMVLESSTRVGKKVLISGGGRCNFTNLDVSSQDYVSQNPHFCKSALRQFSNQDFIRLVKEERIPYYEKTLGQLFCKGSSKEILALLLKLIRDLDVYVETSVSGTKVHKEDQGFKISCSKGNYDCDQLVVACGGLSFPQLGASSFGYDVAKQFGHSITELHPALDGFVFDETLIRQFEPLAGLSALVQVTVGKNKIQENLLFTHVGLSGPVILKASLYWSPADTVRIDFLPEVSDFNQWFQLQREQHPKKKVLNLLTQVLSSRLFECLLSDDPLLSKNMADVSKVDLKKMTRVFKEFTFTPKSTVGYKKAEVTRGGVDTSELSSKSMESKLVSGLYFVGEVLDVTGLLGGYNFQWAWSSGWVAGQSV